jgi:hypothetical protein
MTNFRAFIESAGAYTSDRVDTTSFDGKTHPQVSLEFPTVEKQGEVIGVKVQGASYRIQINGGITVDIPRKIYHKKYNRLPRHRTKDHPGDTVTAVFYKYKSNDEKDYRLKSFDIHHVR